LHAPGNPTPIADAAGELLSALGPVGGPASLVIANQQISGSNGEGGSHNLTNALGGISIYFANGNNGGGQPTLTNLYVNTDTFSPFNNATKWGEVLVAPYVAGAPTSGPGRIRSGVRPIGGTVTGDSGVVFLPLIRR